MATKFKLDITTPGKLVFSGEVEMAVIPGEEGEFGVLAEHSELISNLKAGVVKVFANANDNESVEGRIFVAGGFAEVNPSATAVLATEAYDLSKVSRAEVEGRINDATAKLNTAETDFEKRRAQEIIELNQAILAVL